MFFNPRSENCQNPSTALVSRAMCLDALALNLLPSNNDVAEIEYLRGMGNHQDLHHQHFDVFQETLAQGVQRVMTEMLAAATKKNATES